MGNELLVLPSVPAIDRSRMREALVLLKDAVSFACDLDRTLWDFAVTIDESPRGEYLR